MKKTKEYQKYGISEAGFQKWFRERYPKRNLKAATEADYFNFAVMETETPEVTIFIKDQEKANQLCEDLVHEILVPRWRTLSKEEQPKFAEEFIIKCWNSFLSQNLVYCKLGNVVNKPLKKILNKNYDTIITTSEGRKLIEYLKPCKICGETFHDTSRNRLKKCCSPECDSIYRKRKRDAKKGIDQKIVHQKTCLMCGKSLDGKRLGTLTCSPAHRKQLSRLSPRPK